METIVETILASMSNVKKHQRTFMLSLFAVLVVFQGKATFKNMARYSGMCEKRFRRWSNRVFDYAEFNTKLIALTFTEQEEQIAAIDGSFISKSGRQTEGLAWFYNGSAGEAQQGLEISTICITDLKSNTAYAQHSRQTIDIQGVTRVEQYAQHVIDVAANLRKLNIKYLAADAYYSKVKFVSKVLETGLHLVGKLRVDADLQWLYQGKYNGIGRPRRFDGKIDFEDLGRFESVGILDDNITVYTQMVYSKSLKREIRVVMLNWYKGKKIGRALLYSTDILLDAMTLIKYYKARFQIEFLFRDAKQYTGLTHCQSRRKEAINMQVNASLTALNLLKVEDRTEKLTSKPSVISIASWKRRKFNQHLMGRLFNALGLDLSCKKVEIIYEQYGNYGAIAS
ncbi:transposase [Psychromonas arctica]|uniref:transposase n=1 Tax=Psychromonas arctica TaxID=168275 RepID=UPI0003F5C54A|nr:transposase [Psychromonas arctica]